MRNVEIKARATNSSKLLTEAKLMTNGKFKILNQYDTFYKVPNGRMKLRELEVCITGSQELG